MKSKVLQLGAASEHSSATLRNLAGGLGTLLRRVLHMTEPRPRRLHLLESLPLGERRFVAVVEYGAARFLLGGTSSSIVLLAQLGVSQKPSSSAENHAPLCAEEVER